MNFDQITRIAQWRPAHGRKKAPAVTVITEVQRNTPSDLFEDLKHRINTARTTVEFIVVSDGLEPQPVDAAHWIVYPQGHGWSGLYAAERF